MHNRITADCAYMHMTLILGNRSTCLDKQVGCIIVDEKNIIIASGYNGAPRGVTHCTDLGYCIKEKYNNPDWCPSAHAEQNALLQCKEPDKIHTIYSTLSPCVSCIRVINNTSCKRIVYHKEYLHPEARDMWKGEWCNYGYSDYVREYKELP